MLRSRYRFGFHAIAAALRRLIALPTVALEDAERVGRALDRFGAGLDFADAMHLAAANRGETFVTFDQALIRRAAGLGVPVQAP